MDKSNWALIATTLITVAGTIAVAVINRPDHAPSQGVTRERASASPAVTSTAPPAPVIAPSPAASIDGEWRDQFDARFTIASAGERVMLRGVAGNKSMQGSGTLVGNRLRVAITNSVDAGTIACDGAMTTATSIRSDCVEPNGNRFGWQLDRLP